MTQPIVVERKPIPDPNITIGIYRILARTDGRFVVFDERLPPGQTAAIEETKEKAVAAAEELVARGCPLVSAIEPRARDVPRAPKRTS